jgi:putative ABC transport system permease protein
MTTGLIRAETASDLRVLTAEGASVITRLTLAAATAGPSACRALGLPGPRPAGPSACRALGLPGPRPAGPSACRALGTAAAYLMVIARAHSSLGTTLRPSPTADLIVILAGLPLAAAASCWLLAGREPPAIGRQPLE